MSALIIGIAFGFLLERAGLTRHEKVVGVFRLSDFTLLKSLGSALVVGAAAVQAGISLRLVEAVPITPTSFVAQALGGGTFGIAMALSGFCPGTIVAGAGTGRLDALIPGVGGLLVGALAFGRFSPSVGAPATLPASLGVSPWLIVILMAEIALFGFYLLEKGGRR